MIVLAVFAGAAIFVILLMAGAGIYFYNRAVENANATIVSLTEQFQKERSNMTEQFQIERYKMREHELGILRQVLERVQQPLPPLQFQERERVETNDFQAPITMENDSIIQDLLTQAHETGTDG